MAWQRESTVRPPGTRFARHLARFGPDRQEELSLTDAQRFCEDFAREHSENFPVLSWAVPASLRPDFAAVYAYCRWADDLGDEVESPERALELLDWWEDELSLVFDGTPTHPVMMALRPVAQRHHLPPEPFRDLLSAFRQDQTVMRYTSFNDLLDYCRRSANPVGRLVLGLIGAASETNFASSDSICTGLQLANFWQDISVDRLKGRLYVPADRMQSHGVTEAEIEVGTNSPPFVQLLKELVDDADQRLVEGLPLARRLPGRFGPMVAMFAEGGRAILRRIRADKYNTARCRPRLGKLDRWSIVLKGLAFWAGVR